MKRLNRILQQLNSVFLCLWLPALLFSGWLVLVLFTWFFPYRTIWVSFIRQFSVLFFLLGILLHLGMLILHQQILFMQDSSSHTLSNLTVELFFHKMLRLFLWSLPGYIFFAGILVYHSKYLFILYRWFLSGSWELGIALLFICLALIVSSVYWISMSLLYRYEEKQHLFLPAQIWARAIKLYFSHLPTWLWTYLLCLVVGVLFLVSCWFCWLLIGRFQPDPFLFWEWFYPEHWLTGVILASIGFESFCLSFFSIAAIESILTR